MIADLTKAGHAPETVAKTMRWVRLTLNQAVRDRRIVTSPANGIQLHVPRRSDMRLLDPQQVELLAEAMPDRYQSFPIVAAYTGLRWGELAGLLVGNIDMLRRRLTVRTSLIEAAGVPPRLGSPKTAASERTITLPRIVTETLGIHFHSHPPSTGWCGPPNEAGFSGGARSAESGARRSPNRSANHACHMISATPRPHG